MVTLSTRITIRNAKAWLGILDIAVSRAKREPHNAKKVALYAQGLAESIGAIEIFNGSK